MDKIIFVVGDRQHPNSHHIKLSGTVTVGRAYHNDVVLSDPYVEPTQLVFHFVGGERSIDVLPGSNPVYRNGETAAPGNYRFNSGDEWSVGKSRLTVFDEHHAVAPAEKLFVQDFRGGWAAQLGILLLASTVLVGWVGLHDWLGNFRPLETGKDLARILSSGYILFAVFWAIFWGIIGRFTSGRGQFNVHLAMAVAFVVADMAIDDITAYASYIFNGDLFWQIVDMVCSAGAMALLLTACFSHALHIRGIKYLALGFGACLPAIDYLHDLSEQNPLAPHFNAAVKPPFALVLEPDPVEDFMQQADRLFKETAQKAAESSPVAQP